ncbi:hypothetical protein [Clostridium sp. CF012]|nr:hypothetical protein [Clostridium sp. CF012]
MWNNQSGLVASVLISLNEETSENPQLTGQINAMFYHMSPR